MYTLVKIQCGMLEIPILVGPHYIRWVEKAANCLETPMLPHLQLQIVHFIFQDNISFLIKLTQKWIRLTLLGRATARKGFSLFIFWLHRIAVTVGAGLLL